MKSLYVRIVATIFLVMITSSIIAFLIANTYYQQYLKPENDAKITSIVDNIVLFYSENNEMSINDYLKQTAEMGFQLYLVDTDLNGTYYGGEFRNQTISHEIIHTVLNGEKYHGIANFPSSAFITGFFDNDLSNTVGAPISINNETYALFLRPNIEFQFGELRMFFTVLIFLTILFSILLIAISTRHIVNPITKLTAATKKIAKGHYQVELDVNRSDEIGELAAHFSEMTRGLEQLEEMRQQFVSNVSHEIQSPLSSIKGFAQTLQMKDLTKEQQQRYLNIIVAESNRISQLSKQLLLLASLDNEQVYMEKMKYDLAEQIRQVVFMLEWSWREKDMMIELDLPPIHIYGDPKLLQQVWINLLTNSIKYTHKGGTITISLLADDEYCHVIIQDNGEGIKEQDLPYIFNRFYRGDKARRRDDQNSTGLGLSITKKIIDLHEGNIRVQSTINEGTTFHIYVPYE